MNYEAINFGSKFRLFDEQWQPKVIAEMNDYQFKIVRLEGDFVWHDHKDTDETFIVLEGVLRIDFRDGAVHLSAGETLSRKASNTNLSQNARSFDFWQICQHRAGTKLVPLNHRRRLVFQNE